MKSLTIRNLSKTYFDLYAGTQVTAVHDVSLEVPEGEFVSIVGPSGCGKSTILNMIAGFIPITGGEILVGGRPVKGPGPDRGVVFQSFALFPWRTVLENVAFGPKMRGIGKAEREKIAHEYLALAKLTEAAERYPNELSGGMQQRVGVVRALANEPDVLLMDEPFASVDAQTRMTLQEELTRIWQEKEPDRHLHHPRCREKRFFSPTASSCCRRAACSTRSPSTCRVRAPGTRCTRTSSSRR